MSGTAINVLYFAQVAELVATRQESWPLAEPIDAATWLGQLESRYPQLAPTKRLKLAINQFHARPGSIISPGDEVAVFEPVTGG